MHTKVKQPQQTYCTPETRRSFDDEFKRQAIALMETGRPGRHLARELEITSACPSRWVTTKRGLRLFSFTSALEIICRSHGHFLHA